MASKKGPSITVDPAACCGCLICGLRCSLRFEKAFNPSASAVQVRRLAGAATEYHIFFTEVCDNCGICARYCPYGALMQAGKGAA